MDPTLFIAAKAFIEYQSKILLLRESTKYQEGTNHGRFDVPGGRMQPGESVKNCLMREVFEETGLKVTIGPPFFVSEWHPHVSGNQWQVVGIYFRCTSTSNNVTLSPDHNEHIWIQAEDYPHYSLIPGLDQAFSAYIQEATF